MGKSIYLTAPEDPRAAYLTAEHYPVAGDGVHDDTDAIQMAIDQVKNEQGFGVVFIPEGEYRITRTIFVPKAIRLIGYGQNRPKIVLADNAPGFDRDVPGDKGKSKYMFWYVDRVPRSGEPVRDANAGTFYSAMVNIDLKIGKGNPCAVALRTHFAQHSLTAHIDIDIGGGRAGMFDVGNEMEDVRFFGGDYGIITEKTSPGWPFVMMDSVFSGQRTAAIKTQEVGLTVIRARVSDVPVFIDIADRFHEKLYAEECVLENVTEAAVAISLENNSANQVNLRRFACKNVPVLTKMKESGKTVDGAGELYMVDSFVHGRVVEALGAQEKLQTKCEQRLIDALPAVPESDIPQFPPVSSWVNAKALGIKGDNETDDTDTLEAALAKYDVIYLPQGWYRISRPLKMRPGTALIGLNPISTQLVAPDNCEVFGDVGAPLPLLEVLPGGKNILSGIGINAGANNPRIVGCKWSAGEGSFMNDVKFIGGHGSMSWDGKDLPFYNDSHSCDPDINRRWDDQYWSLWVKGGGGIFKDIWSASTFAAAGVYICDTDIPSKIYAMSVEHHCRNEVKFKKVRNWSVYGLQTEEEVAESQLCQPLELRDCEDMLFADVFLFRVIWLYNPYPYAITTENCKNVEILNADNFTQVKYTMNNLLFDRTSGIEVRPWQLAKLTVGAPKVEAAAPCAVFSGKARKLAGGFEFPDMICADEKGNVYFGESRLRRIYQWNAESESLRLIWDAPFKPLGLTCDTEGRLLIVYEFIIPKGATRNGRPVVGEKPNDQTAYGIWYRGDAVIRAAAIDPEDPEDSLQMLERVPASEIKNGKAFAFVGNRWRDTNDYLEKTVEPWTEAFVAPDGVTVIPYDYDLIRMSTLLTATPGKKFYACDEYLKRIVSFDVDEKGQLHNAAVVAERGEYGVAQDEKGRLFVPNGQLYVFGEDGKALGQLETEDRPSCVAFGGRDKKTLFMTTRSGFYAVSVN